MQVFTSTKLQVFKEEIAEILKTLPQFSGLSPPCLSLWRLNVEMNTLFEDFRRQIAEKSDEIPLENAISSSFFAVDGEKLDFYKHKTLKELDIKEESSILLEIRAFAAEPGFLQRKDAKNSLKKRNFLELAAETKENAVFIAKFVF